MTSDPDFEADAIAVNEAKQLPYTTRKEGLDLMVTQALGYYTVTGQVGDLLESFYGQVNEVIEYDLTIWYVVLFSCYVVLYLILLAFLQCQIQRRILLPILNLTELIKNPIGLEDEKHAAKVEDSD